MFSNAIKEIRNKIFPIFFQSIQGNLTQIGVSGTGFFIDNKGHFLTAHHVTVDVPLGSKLLYCGNVPDKFVQPMDIKEVFSDPIRDIFLGKIDKDYLQAVNLSFDKVDIGKSVSLCGYPLAQLFKDPNGSINVSNVRKYWQPTCVIDYIAAENINGRNYQGFMTQHNSLRGMSGGPVFDTEGIVCGIDVATMTREIPENNQQTTVVANGIVIELSTIKDILEKIK